MNRNHLKREPWHLYLGLLVCAYFVVYFGIRIVNGPAPIVPQVEVTSKAGRIR